VLTLFNKDDLVCDLLGDIFFDIRVAKEKGSIVVNLKE